MDEDRTNANAAVNAVIEKEKAQTDAGETARERQQRREREGGKRHHHRFSFSARLVGAFALTAAMTAVIAASILAFVWEGQFQKYTNENIQNLATKTATRIADSYDAEDAFTNSVLSRASLTSSLYPELGVQVRDVEGTIVYDDTSRMSAVNGETDISNAAKEQVASVPVVVDDEVVGSVSMWAFSSDRMLTQTDLAFRKRSYDAMVFAAIIATALAAIVGLFTSRWLIEPVNRVTETASKVKGGELAARTGMVGDDELSQLGETFDEMADSLQRDRELERRLTADVAHELRTPLMGIQATVEAIIDGVFPADQERLAAINSETTRLKRLVEALLNLSRYESGSVPFNEKPVDITELISGLFLSHEALLDDAGITHSFICDDDPVVVDGDSDMIRQATANLISNAVRYNEEDGDVTVEVHRVENMGCISVSDTGIGIAPEDQEMVFSRFWRADAGRARASGGLGVGLAVVKEIADYHNGYVEVESEKGEGTTFKLYIPLHLDAPYKPAKGIASMIRRPSGKEGNRNRNRDKQKTSKQKTAKQKVAKQQKAAKQRSPEQTAEEKSARRHREANVGRGKAKAMKKAADKAEREREGRSRAEDAGGKDED